MINSLFKDSHITQPFRYSQTVYSQSRGTSKSERLEYSNAPLNNSIGISVNKPAEISFRGLSGAQLSYNGNFQKFINETKTFLGNKASLSNVKKIILESVSVLSGSPQKSTNNIQAYLKISKDNIQDLIKKTDEFVREENKGKILSSKDFEYERKEIINAAVDGVFGLETKDKGFYTNKNIKKFLAFAADKKTVFGAFFALILTGTLRPIAIMLLPSEKKNNDDKKYASAHSIASGLIGYVLALSIFGPISDAVKKVTDHPQDFVKNKNNSYLVKNKKALFTAKNYVSMLPDTILSPTKAVVTVALIPIILKTLFGLEKNKNKEKDIKMQNPQSNNVLDFKSVNDQNEKTFQTVKGGVK